MPFIKITASTFNDKSVLPIHEGQRLRPQVKVHSDVPPERASVCTFFCRLGQRHFFHGRENVMRKATSIAALVALVMAMSVPVVMHAQQMPDVDLTNEGRVPGQPFEYLQDQGRFHKKINILFES